MKKFIKYILLTTLIFQGTDSKISALSPEKAGIGILTLLGGYFLYGKINDYANTLKKIDQLKVQISNIENKSDEIKTTTQEIEKKISKIKAQLEKIDNTINLISEKQENHIQLTADLGNKIDLNSEEVQTLINSKFSDIESTINEFNLLFKELVRAIADIKNHETPLIPNLLNFFRNIGIIAEK